MLQGDSSSKVHLHNNNNVWCYGLCTQGKCKLVEWEAPTLFKRWAFCHPGNKNKEHSAAQPARQQREGT